MNTKKLLVISFLLCCIFSFNSFAQRYNKQKVTLSMGIEPIAVNLDYLPPPVPIVERGIEETKEMGPFKSYEEFELEQKKLVTPKQFINIHFSDKAEIEYLSNISINASFKENSRIKLTLEPGDPSIAVGKEQVVMLNNDGIYIYNKYNNNLIYKNSYRNFFNSDMLIFDPIVMYDYENERWIFTIVARDDIYNQSFLYIAISKTDNPTGEWYYYVIDGGQDGIKRTKYWADRPYLSISSDNKNKKKGAIVITSNQYDFVYYYYQYCKVRLFNKEDLYSGKPLLEYWDFWRFQSNLTSDIFNLAPATQLTPTPDANVYFFQTNASGGNRVFLWRLNNPLSDSPEMEEIRSINVTNYSVPPYCPVKEQKKQVNIFDCRVLNVVYADNILYAAYNTKYDWGEGNNCIFRVLKISTINGELISESGYGAKGYWYMFPCIMPLKDGNRFSDTLLIGFVRGADFLYPESRVVLYDGSSKWGKSVLVSEGVKPKQPMGRLGDYNSIIVDPYNSRSYWFASCIAGSDLWSTNIANIEIIK
ncbi:MAG: hypothetical protein N2490_00700 [Ignavibacteria bacterium]|nr:hypothetical protein [Ignavibacteria bacterium]